MQIVTAQEARTKAVQSATSENKVHDYFGASATVHEGPQGFIAEQGAGARIDPHFHDVDQFQVICSGGGAIGREKIHVGSFHFVDAFMPYGPIFAKEEGIAFYTLRLAAAGGYFGMPGSRKMAVGRPVRNIAGDFHLGKIQEMTSPEVHEVLVDGHADNLKIEGIRLRPNVKGKGAVSDGGGQYCVIFTGSIIHQGKVVPARSLIFVAPGEPAPVFEAGPDGAEILVLQFPKPTERPGSNPAKLAGRDPKSYASYGRQTKIVN